VVNNNFGLLPPKNTLPTPTVVA